MRLIDIMILKLSCEVEGSFMKVRNSNFIMNPQAVTFDPIQSLFLLELLTICCYNSKRLLNAISITRKKQT